MKKIKILYEEIFLSKSPSVLESITKIVSDKLRATLSVDYPLFIQKVSVLIIKLIVFKQSL